MKNRFKTLKDVYEEIPNQLICRVYDKIAGKILVPDYGQLSYYDTRFDDRLVVKVKIKRPLFGVKQCRITVI